MLFMYVIEVIPLKKGISIESLSYYSSTGYEAGTILQIPIKNKKITGVVVSTKSVSLAKTALRTATFSLKKLEIQPNATSLPKALVQTAQKISEHIPAHLGSLLFAMLPPDIRNGLRNYPHTQEHTNDEDSTPTILTNTYADRYISYRSHIRQTFAHRGSVLFIVPTSVDVERAKKQLESGIEKRVITFASTHTKRQIDLSYQAFDDLSQAKLIIATASYAFLDRHDITTIIVESSGSQHYISRSRPYIDVREALKEYAKVTNRSIILGDSLPLTEDEIKRRDEVYHTYEEHTKRLPLQSTLLVTTHPKSDDNPDAKFSLCTDELLETITRILNNRGNIFLHAARRGIAPLVVCYDCGHIFRCPDSGAPYSLLKTYKNSEEERWFFSTTSGKRVRAADVCPECGSWRLRQQGIGIQQVHDVIRTQFPKAEIFLLDHTTAKTHNKAKSIIKNFYESKKAILIGTNMAFPYITKPVECSAVISYEAMRAVPTWRADESVFAQLITLREITSKDVIVGTRNEPDELHTLATKGLIDQFYDGEIAVRKALAYPPFSVFILLSWAGTKEQTQEVETLITKQLPQTEVQFYSAPQSTDQETVRYGLIRTPTPSKETIDQLRTLPAYIKSEVNPARIV